ncbi:amidohydrolase family protein [Flavitalea sp. BT771]|uniref:amidohydrolase family protein n=1 Tax=Flavitalea sp. BT771 TaxID=3063329 RepID=UPI0026E29454|nr:amidohydrolase family protein [Flavitalea sp. BT771]MDO6431404.1 amidohydrolase family protein [Flavitalea sp. BT771]MDV6220312.1 amidohydrolase family protein [Flavitalea sp. BT771]
MRFLQVLMFLAASNCSFAQTYALLADRLIDGKSDQVISNPTVIVRQGKIIDVNFNRTIPDSAIVIDLKGQTLLPGLMDVHTHLLGTSGDYEKDLYDHSPTYRALRAVMHMRTALNNGITTLRDVCSEGAGYADVDLARAVDSGFVEGPHIFPAGKGIAATGQYFPLPRDQNWSIDLPYGTQFTTGTDECIKAVREQYSRGVTWIKMYGDFITPTFSAAEMKAIVSEAKKLGLDVAAHANTSVGIRLAIEAGVRSIEHGREFNDSLIKLALAHGTFWCPTISGMERHPGPLLDSIHKYLNRAYKAKLAIVMGTDATSWNINETKELEYYVKNAGLSPMDAIKTATLNAASLLRIQNSLGQIKKGFTADIIAVAGNPLEDITLLQHVDFVMKEGKVIKRP